MLRVLQWVAFGGFCCVVRFTTCRITPAVIVGVQPGRGASCSKPERARILLRAAASQQDKEIALGMATAICPGPALAGLDELRLAIPWLDISSRGPPPLHQPVALAANSVRRSSPLQRTANHALTVCLTPQCKQIAPPRANRNHQESICRKRLAIGSAIRFPFSCEGDFRYLCDWNVEPTSVNQDEHACFHFARVGLFCTGATHLREPSRCLWENQCE